MTPPRRILVLGAGGAGKSTLARGLGARLGLPVIHLDAHYWHAGWVETPSEEWAGVVDRLAAGDRWVMDGNYGGTLERRLARCDAAILLDTPRLTSLWRVLRRWLRHRGQSRPDMAPGCPEQMSWEFVHWIWTYPGRRRSEILEHLERLRAERKRVVVLRSSADVDALVASLAEDAGAVPVIAPDGGPRPR